MKPWQPLPALLLLLLTGLFPASAASVSTLLEQLERAPALEVPETPGAVLQRVLAGEGHGSDCLTPLLLAAERRPVDKNGSKNKGRKTGRCVRGQLHPQAGCGRSVD